MKLAFLAANANVFPTTNQKVMYVYVKVQLLKMSSVYSLASVRALFVMISTASSNVPLRSQLA